MRIAGGCGLPMRPYPQLIDRNRNNPITALPGRRPMVDLATFARMTPYGRREGWRTTPRAGPTPRSRQTAGVCDSSTSSG
jgi:hypothetical protein